MPNFYSFLQTAYRFIKSLAVNVTKKMYRSAAVLATGLAVVMVVAFNTSSYAGGGKNAAAASREIGEDAAPMEMKQSEEDSTGLETGMTIRVSGSKEQGQQLIGSLLERNIQDDLAKSALEIEQLDREVLMQTQQAAQEAEEKERIESARLKQAEAVIDYTERDYQVLLRIVQAEAGICDDIGKILVADVIINRVRDKNFPDNITDVVYQRSQFSPVIDGSINTCKVTQQTIDCVDRALAGEDHSNGALYFMNRGGSAASNVRWFDGRLTFLMQHGPHEFFK